jgi:hypothetical protein
MVLRGPEDDEPRRDHGRGFVRTVPADFGDASQSDCDDDQDIDHLGRLADRDVLRRVERIEREQRGKRWAEEGD